MINFSEQWNEAPRKCSSTQSYCTLEQCFAEDGGLREVYSYSMIKSVAVHHWQGWFKSLRCHLYSTPLLHQLLLIFENFLFFSSSPTINYSIRERLPLQRQVSNDLGQQVCYFIFASEGGDKTFYLFCATFVTEENK